MKRVFKYPLQIADDQTLRLPAGSQVLSVVNQHEKIMLYAKVNDEVTVMRSHTVIMRGTGQGANGTDGSDFVGTVTLMNGDLVLHVFIRRAIHEKS